MEAKLNTDELALSIIHDIAARGSCELSGPNAFFSSQLQGYRLNDAMILYSSIQHN